jgi:Fe-S-cluster containining protein
LGSSKPDAQRPSTWKPWRGISDCQGCWSGCCTLPLEVSVADLVRLGLTTETEAASGLRQLARRLIDERVIERFHAKTQIFTVAQRAGRDCIFLDARTRRCTVYEKRPEVCRKFPKEVGPRLGFCPKRA